MSRQRFDGTVVVLLLTLFSVPLHARPSENPRLTGLSYSESIRSGFVQPTGIAASRTGPVVVGRFTRTIDFDPSKKEAVLVSSHIFNTFVAKYNPAGKLRWARAFSGLNVEPADVAVDSDGSIVVVGRFFDTVDFDPGPDEFVLIAPAGSNGYVVKLDRKGDFLWARQHPEAGSRAEAVAIDSEDAIWVASRPHRTNTLVKLSSEGDVEFQAELGFSIFDMQSGPDDTVYLTGRFGGIEDLDPGSGVHNAVSNGHADIFVSRLTSDADLMWVATAGGTRRDLGWTLAVGQDGSVLSGGRMDKEVDFDPDPTKSHVLTSTHRYLWKLSANGELEWVRPLVDYDSPSSLIRSLDVAVKPDGTALVVGGFLGRMDFEMGSGTNAVISRSDEGFVATLDADGETSWVGRVGGGLIDRGTAVATQGGLTWATGWFSSPADLDPTSRDRVVNAHGRYNLFLLTLTMPGR